MTSLWKPSIDSEKTKNIVSRAERAVMTSEVYPLHIFHKWAYAIRRQKEEEGKEKGKKVTNFPIFTKLLLQLTGNTPAVIDTENLKISFLSLTLPLP